MRRETVQVEKQTKHWQEWCVAWQHLRELWGNWHQDLGSARALSLTVLSKTISKKSSSER